MNSVCAHIVEAQVSNSLKKDKGQHLL